jgi:tetratricopeptide (TPR) repeat protein
MSSPFLTLGLLLTGCFSLAAWLGPRFDRLSLKREKGFVANTLGESRRLFANHFFARSDIYFHSGYYPSIFDRATAMKSENHLASQATEQPAKNPAHGEAGHVHDDHEDEHEGEEHDFLGKPKDPMDAFSRNFFVSKHTHLSEKGTNAPKEILPWIKLASKLDPKLTGSYTVGAYWLRQLHKDDEAEQFLREGLRQNPHSYEIMLELGRGYFEKRDYERARNVLEMGLQKWREQQNPKPDKEKDMFSLEQIANYLARVEDRGGNRDRVIHWLELLKKISPTPEEIDKRIAEIRAGQRLEAQ